jgi:hypothetical protein
MTIFVALMLLACIFIGAVIVTFWDDIKKAFKKR